MKNKLLRVLLFSFYFFIFSNNYLETTQFKGGYYKVFTKYVYHAYLITVDRGQKTRFKCYLGTIGFDDDYPAVEAPGDLKFARTICTFNPDNIKKSYCGFFSPYKKVESSGISFGVTGICHQMTNRLLYSAGSMMFPNWWIAPYVIYGLYGNKNTISEVNPEKKYSWVEYLAAAKLKSENQPVTEASIQVKIPEVKSVIQNIALKYPDKEKFILYEINNYNMPSWELSINRIFLIIRELDQGSYFEQYKAEIERNFKGLYKEVEELGNEIEANPDRHFINMIKVYNMMSKIAKWFIELFNDIKNNNKIDASGIEEFNAKFHKVLGFTLD